MSFHNSSFANMILYHPFEFPPGIRRFSLSVFGLLLPALNMSSFFEILCIAPFCFSPSLVFAWSLCKSGDGCIFGLPNDPHFHRSVSCWCLFRAFSPCFFQRTAALLFLLPPCTTLECSPLYPSPHSPTSHPPTPSNILDSFFSCVVPPRGPTLSSRSAHLCSCTLLAFVTSPACIPTIMCYSSSPLF